MKHNAVILLYVYYFFQPIRAEEKKIVKNGREDRRKFQNTLFSRYAVDFHCFQWV